MNNKEINMVKATLKNANIIDIEYGKWQGMELDIIELDCGYGFAYDAKPISTLKNLRKLVINGAFLHSLSFVEPLRQLESLECAINKIADLAPLKNLKRLRSLRLSENSITDITPLEGLENLSELDVSDNCIKSLAPIAKIKNLKLIDFTYQRPLIKDLTPLKEPKDLEIVLVGQSPATYNELKLTAETNKEIAGLIKIDYKM